MVAEKVLNILKRIKSSESRKIFDSELFRNTSLIRSIAIPDGEQLVFGILINDDFCNVHGSLHGGAISTLVDCVTTVHTWARDPAGRIAISTDLSMAFYSYVLPKQYLEITTVVTSINERFSFTTASLAVGNLVVARGTQTLFFLDKTASNNLFS